MVGPLQGCVTSAADHDIPKNIVHCADAQDAISGVTPIKYVAINVVTYRNNDIY